MIIRRGDKEPEVARVQRLLGIIVDGDFGPATQAAIETFQQNNNLTVDGIVGPITLQALEANSNEIILEPKNLSPIVVREERNQDFVNKQLSISPVDDLVPQINDAATQDSKPQGLQRLGKLIVDLVLKLKNFFLPQLTALLLSYKITI